MNDKSKYENDNTYSEATRAEALAVVDEVGVPDAALQLGISAPTLYRWVSERTQIEPWPYTEDPTPHESRSEWAKRCARNHERWAAWYERQGKPRDAERVRGYASQALFLLGVQ